MPRLIHREALVKTSVQFTPEQTRRLALLAEQEDRKVAYIVRQAVTEYLQRHPEPTEEAA